MGPCQSRARVAGKQYWPTPPGQLGRPSSPLKTYQPWSQETGHHWCFRLPGCCGGHLAATPEAPLPMLQAQLLCSAARLWAQETLLNF